MRHVVTAGVPNAVTAGVPNAVTDGAASAYVRRMARGNVGPLVRQWRTQRARSQMDLALQVGVSPRHLSFVETGKSRPSPELIEAIGVHLDIPLRDRNAMLLAAGYAPRYGRTPLDDAALADVVASLRRLLAAHEPYPGVVLDRQWNVVLANAAAGRMTAGLPSHLTEPTVNVFRASLHPDGLARVTANFDDWAGYLVSQLDRLIAITNDAGLQAVRAEVLEYPAVRAAVTRRQTAPPAPTRELLVPFQLAVGDGVVSMFTTLTSFGAPRDITLDELAVELFFPADAASAEWFGGPSRP